MTMLGRKQFYLFCATIIATGTFVFGDLLLSPMVSVAAPSKTVKSAAPKAVSGTIKKSVVEEPRPVITEEDRLIALIDRSLPSVVNVVGSRSDTNGKKEVILRGTGFVADPQGILLTNRHVVSQSDLTYTVYFPDRTKYIATVLGRDPLNDLAILKISGGKFPALPLGNSDNIRIGQTAITIGNSLGRYSNTVTKGIISGLGRSVSASDNITGQTETLDDVIQTDAAINLGNSGGPLLNSKGEVLGINTAIEQSGRGVGFAIPINDAKRILDSYQRNGRIVRPYLGVRYLSVTTDIEDQFKLFYDYGALINSGELSNGPAIVQGSPAEKAGLREGDLVLAVDGILLKGSTTLLKVIQQKKPGAFITLMIARGKYIINVEATLVEIPSSLP